MDKATKPTDSDLKEKLGSNYQIWAKLKSYLFDQLKDPSDEWNYPGKKYGWSFRVKSKKRNIIYFLPRDGYFKVAFVFGDKAVSKIEESDVQQFIKTKLAEAKRYAEGRGIRIDVKNSDMMDNIKTLINIKLEN